MSSIPLVPLNNGVEIPQLGFGLFQVPPEETVATLESAIAIGYRHIDTAQGYRNEREVGLAVDQSQIGRDEFFITSKLASSAIGYDAALSGFDDSVAALNIEILDLYLIHWPLPTIRDFTDTWRAFERIYAEGRVRAIGVSNFQPAHLQRLFDECEIVPAVNQIEVHPYFNQFSMLELDTAHGIVTEAYSPIARGAVHDDAVLQGIGASKGKSAAQVTLRWHIQLGTVVFPKSMSPARMRENYEIFDFSLDDNEMETIAKLNRDERRGPNPDTFEGPRR